MKSQTPPATGPLAGVRVLLVGGIGPGPFAAQQLGDMGADVLKIDRPGDAGRPPGLMARNQRSVVLDLKSPEDIATALAGTAAGWALGLSKEILKTGLKTHGVELPDLAALMQKK